MTAITPEGNKFTLRGKIGSRPTRRPRRWPSRITLMIGIYVAAVILGWTLIGVLIAVRWPT